MIKLPTMPVVSYSNTLRAGRALTMFLMSWGASDPLVIRTSWMVSCVEKVHDLNMLSSRLLQFALSPSRRLRLGAAARRGRRRLLHQG